MELQECGELDTSRHEHRTFLRLLILKGKRKATCQVDNYKTSTVGDLLRICAAHFCYESEQSRALFKARCLDSENTLAHEGIRCGDMIVVTYIETEVLPGDFATVFKVDEKGFCVKRYGTVQHGQLFLANTVDVRNLIENRCISETDLLPQGICILNRTSDCDSGLSTHTSLSAVAKFKPSKITSVHGSENERRVVVSFEMRRKFLKKARKTIKKNQGKTVLHPNILSKGESNWNMFHLEASQNFRRNMSMCSDDNNCVSKDSVYETNYFSDDRKNEIKVSNIHSGKKLMAPNIFPENDTCSGKLQKSGNKKTKCASMNQNVLVSDGIAESGYLSETNTQYSSKRSQYTTANSIDEISVALGIGETTHLNVESKGAWAMALNSKDENEAQCLIQSNILPTFHELELACNVFGRQSEIVAVICANICSYLKKKSDDIVDIWPAYKAFLQGISGTILLFVVCTKKGTVEDDFESFNVFQRGMTNYSSESRIVLEKELTEKLNWTLMENLQQSIAKNAPKLMEKHCNINMVSASFFKSRHFGTTHQEFTKCPCIVLYVHIKGLIPIKEDPFPTEIDGFPVDVREAGFTPFTGGPNEFHQNLKIGCAVHAAVKTPDGQIMGGTLGGFIYHPDYGRCCVTCAHVVMSPDDMIKIRDGNAGTVIFGPGQHKEVYQPVCAGSRPFGRLVCVIYKEGGDGKSGVDVALIQMIDRLPVSGDFPEADNYKEAGFDKENPMVFESGKVCELTDKHVSSEVYKFGASTNVTRGIVRMNGSFVRQTHMCGYSHFGYLLNNQAEILSVGSKPFAEAGDSGAFVFAKDRSNKLVAVGMLEGGMTDGRVMITPMSEILRELKDISGNAPASLPTACPPFYLQMGLINASLSECDDSGVHLDVSMDVDNCTTICDETRPKLTENQQVTEAAFQAMQAEVLQLKTNVAQIFEILKNANIQNSQSVNFPLPVPHGNF